MSFPYLSDLINPIFGTQWNIPIAMFGSFVAIAMIVSTIVAKREIIRLEKLGLLTKATIAPGVFVPTHKIVDNLTVISSLFGMLGARLFHILEYPQVFLDNPIGMILTRGGFSIYGGLICGGIAGAVYLKKRAVPLLPMLDALAPSMILGYGIGRIGCQISGDGDWGIAAIMDLKPNWLPDWLWAQTYTNNIVGLVIPSPGVYPTPLYEVLAAFGIFLFLWAIRKTKYSKGYMFSSYLLLTGFERLLIEKIRINSKYHFFGIDFTQAEFISTVLILIGLLGILKATQAKRISKVVFSLFILGALSACSKL
ncbi:prolipoprotein diacylglyceryl transferase family protein [Methylomonas sp. AM2-LC]|uniref:prolipoprotein diacylglyceryl transferase n=1 Tax=Methylomonas sp. AM2-LC TaxID=3153301 RepID=UPI003266B026